MKIDEIQNINDKCLAAYAYQAAKSNRQCMYNLVKSMEAYSLLYLEADDYYKAVCTTLGVEPEPVFDLDEYQKSNRYKDIVEGLID